MITVHAVLEAARREFPHLDREHGVNLDPDSTTVEVRDHMLGHYALLAVTPEGKITVTKRDEIPAGTAGTETADTIPEAFAAVHRFLSEGHR